MSASKVAVTGLARGARFYRADLHVHSFGGSHDVKDASMTPEQIVQRAIDEGLDVVGIADHNEISNVQAAMASVDSSKLAIDLRTEFESSTRATRRALSRSSLKSTCNTLSNDVKFTTYLNSS